MTYIFIGLTGDGEFSTTPTRSDSMIPVDYHLHSTFSKDGEATVAEVCDASLITGLPGLASSRR